MSEIPDDISVATATTATAPKKATKKDERAVKLDTLRKAIAAKQEEAEAHKTQRAASEKSYRQCLKDVEKLKDEQLKLLMPE